MKKWVILAVIASLITFTFVYADDGYVNADGYTYNAGYWYYNNQAYTRYKVESPGYWYCGRYYPGSYTWKYAIYNTPVAAKTVSSADPDWRSKLLDIAAQRDKHEAGLRKGLTEHQYFLESVKALGLEGNFRWQGYGTIPQYAVPDNMPYSNNQVYGSVNQVYGANASTQYGYSYNTIAQLYGDTNLNQLYQQAAQLTEHAQKLSGDANTGFQTLVGQEGNNRARVAEALAKGQVAVQVLQSLQGPSTFETKGYSFKIMPGGKIEKNDADVDVNTKTEINKQWLSNAQSRCAECHSPTLKKGGFDYTKYPTMTPEQKMHVWVVLTSNDDKVVMPRNKDGSPGKHLTNDELKLWFLN